MNMYGDFVVTGIIASYLKQLPGGSLVKERKFTKRHQTPVNELVLLFGHIVRTRTVEYDRRYKPTG